jgi:hypothetical protein
MRKHDIDIYRLALQMADTGQFADWHDVEKAMVEKGIRKAPELLDNDKIRFTLDIKCAQGCAAALH